MIKSEVLSEAIYKTILRGSCHAPDDIVAAFEDAITRENNELAKKALERTYGNIIYARENNCLACSDTGWPLFYFKIGENAQLEGGFCHLEDICRKMVAKATKKGYLRATVKHPLTGFDPGDNVGENVPSFTYKFIPGNDIEVTFVAKGGGSECFGGTRYKMVAFADGEAGIEKFIIESYISACRSGKICPPAVLGIGIGGTADISAKLAKQASSLRTVNSRHPELGIAALEDKLTKAINMLGIGAFGLGGRVSVFSVNIEYAYSHLGGIAVSMAASCCITRRSTTVICADNTIKERSCPNWFGGR